MRRPIVAAVLPPVLAPLLLLLPACGLGPLGGGSEGGYHLTAHFAEAVGLYPHGDVTLMGIGVGTVDAVELEDDHVRVEMTIDADVPLPDDVEATIEPLQLIGERNVVLFPAWSEAMSDEGRARMVDGDVIGLDRTHVPVEPDEGLEAFNDLAESLDPEIVGGLVSDSADVLAGQGENLGAAIDRAASLSDLFARTDDDIVAAAEALHELAATVSTRDRQLAAIVRSFSGATAVLADEREGISRFLAALVGLTEQGQGLLDTYGTTLPTDVANLALLAGILRENRDSVAQLLVAFLPIAEGIEGAYDPSIDGLRLRATLNPTLLAMIDAFSEILGVLPSPDGP